MKRSSLKPNAFLLAFFEPLFLSLSLLLFLQSFTEAPLPGGYKIPAYLSIINFTSILFLLTQKLSMHTENMKHIYIIGIIKHVLVALAVSQKELWAYLMIIPGILQFLVLVKNMEYLSLCSQVKKAENREGSPFLPDLLQAHTFLKHMHYVLILFLFFLIFLPVLLDFELTTNTNSLAAITLLILLACCHSLRKVEFALFLKSRNIQDEEIPPFLKDSRTFFFLLISLFLGTLLAMDQVLLPYEKMKEWTTNIPMAHNIIEEYSENVTTITRPDMPFPSEPDSLTDSSTDSKVILSILIFFLLIGLSRIVILPLVKTPFRVNFKDFINGIVGFMSSLNNLFTKKKKEKTGAAGKKGTRIKISPLSKSKKRKETKNLQALHKLYQRVILWSRKRKHIESRITTTPRELLNKLAEKEPENSELYQMINDSLNRLLFSPYFCDSSSLRELKVLITKMEKIK